MIRTAKRRLRPSCELLETRWTPATFAGSVAAVFDSPYPSGATVTGVGSSTFTWGVGQGSAPNQFTFAPNSFDADANRVFSLGRLSYFNGTTTIGTEATSVDLVLDLDFSKPASGGLKSVRYTLGMYSSTNTDDPVASSDSVYLGAGQSVSVKLGKNQYGLEILGFGSTNGDAAQVRDQFFVQESRTDSAELLARFEPTDIGLSGARWLSRAEREPGHLGASAIRFDWSTTGFNGPFSVDVYQSNDAKFDKRDIKLGSTVTIDAGQADRGSGVVYITDAPKRQAFNLFSANQAPRFVLLVARPGSGTNESNDRNNAAAVRVAQPSALSYELESTATLANTRLERVQLWIEKYVGDINASASRFNVTRTAIAGAIAWEALENVKISSAPLPGIGAVRASGPGKVHWFEAFGGSAASQVEAMGYLPVVGTLRRRDLLKRADQAILYVGAIMGAFGDSAARQGVAAPIRLMPEVLATLYQGVSIKKSLIPGAPTYSSFLSKTTPVRPGNADAYFRYKNRAGGNYEANAQMGRWVLIHMADLDSALDP